MPVGDAQVRRFFADCGFEIVRLKGLCGTSPVAIAHVSERELRDAIIEVNGPDVDAIIQVGTNLAMARLAGLAEFWLDKPVLAINTCTYWWALRQNGIETGSTASARCCWSIEDGAMDRDDPALDDAGVAEQIALLAAQVKSADPAQRRAACWQIYEICCKAPERAALAIPVLLPGLADPDEKVGESAAWALRWCAPASIEPLIDCLDDPQPIVRRRACIALGNIGEPAAALTCDVLRQCLTDTAPEVRAQAAKALGLIRDTSSRTIDALFAMARSESARGRAAALHALGNIGKALSDPGPLRAREHEVLAALEDGNADVRWSACYLLESLGLEAPKHVALLMRRLTADTSEEFLWMATGQLPELMSAVDPEAHIPVMCNIIRTGGGSARDMCKALALLGSRADAAVPCLIDALRSEDAFLVIAAAIALWKIAGRVEIVAAAGEGFRRHGPIGVRRDLRDGAGGGAADRQGDRRARYGGLGPAMGGRRCARCRRVEPSGCRGGVDHRAGPSEPDRTFGGGTGVCGDRPRHAAGADRDPGIVRRRSARMGCRGSRPNGRGRAGGDRTAPGPTAITRPGARRVCAIALAKIAGDVASVPMLVELLARSDRPDLQQQAALALAAIASRGRRDPSA